MYANLLMAWRTFMHYCTQINLISQEQADERLEQIKQQLTDDGRELACALDKEKPALRMLSLLGQALAASEAVVANMLGNRPTNAAQLGWNHPSMNGLNQARINAKLIGWVDDNLPDPLLYLLPDHALRVAQSMAGQNEEIRGMEQKQMGKQLKASGLLAKTEGARSTPLVRKTIDSAERKVWVVKLSDVVEIDRGSVASNVSNLRLTDLQAAAAN